MHFDLKPAASSGGHGSAMPEPGLFQLAAECQNVGRERTPKIRRMAARVEPPEILVQFALRSPDPGCVRNHGGGVDTQHRASRSALRENPIDDLTDGFQTRGLEKPQPVLIQPNRCETGGFAIPAEIDANEGVHGTFSGARWNPSSS